MEVAKVEEKREERIVEGGAEVIDLVEVTAVVWGTAPVEVEVSSGAEKTVSGGYETGVTVSMVVPNTALFSASEYAISSRGLMAKIPPTRVEF